MSDWIMQEQDDDREEKTKTTSKMRNEIEEMRQRIKEQEELLQRYQDCSDGKQLTEVRYHDQVISRDTTQMLVMPETHQAVTNITVVRAASSSPFQGKLGRRDVPVVRRERPKSYPYSICDDNVIGIEEDVHQLIQQLMDPQSGNFFAIVGMGGSGKTTLARKIYNHQETSRYFDYRAWICVSQVWSEESVLKDIFSQTTSRNSNNLTVIQIVEYIRELLGNKSFLVVLDDVWERDALRKIIVPIARSNRCKFVITTRNQSVIKFSDLVFNERTPRPLTRDQSFDLFRKIAFGYQRNTMVSHTSEPFVGLAKQMLRKCDGLPLAVISLSGLLRTKKTIQEWMKVGNNVSSKIIEDHSGPSDYGKVEDILGLSYSDLNYTLKCCFMYLSLFPEDVEIPCRTLMRCWIAEGFFKSVWLAADESIEDVARQYLDELIQRCLVQIVRVNYADTVQAIKVHDLLRDLAIKRARTKYFADTYPSSYSLMSTMQFLRLGINSVVSSNLEKLPEDKASRRLRSFVLYLPYFRRRIYLGAVFTNYPLLRVLILEDCSLKDIAIPDAIGSLIHLRYLGLSFYCVHRLPDSLQNLRNLLSFDFRIVYKLSKSYNLPNLKQMKKLRYLRLPWVTKDSRYDLLPWQTGEIMSQYLSPANEYYEKPLNLHDLRKLKELWGIPSGKWMMTELKYLSPSIEKLGIIDIVYQEELNQVYQCPSIVEDNLCALKLKLMTINAEFEMQKIQHCTNLQKLYLDGIIAATGVPFVFPPYLLKLELQNSELDDQDSFADTLQRLIYLKVLILACNAYVGDDLTFPSNSLLNLEKLQLYELVQVKRIHVMEGTMPHLKSFYVGHCDRLRVIPQRLRHLVRRIYDNKERIEDGDFEAVVEYEGSDGYVSNEFEGEYDMFVSDDEEEDEHDVE